jgi:hypothetical protein
VGVEVAAGDRRGVAGAAPQGKVEGVAQPGRAAGVVEVGVGQQVRGELHLSHLFDKLGVANRTQAVARARELGLLP